MATNLPPIPNNPITDAFVWRDWFFKVSQVLVEQASIAWTSLDFTGSNLLDIQTRQHNSLQAVQGGNSGQYYHLTSAEHTLVQNLATTNTNKLLGRYSTGTGNPQEITISTGLSLDSSGNLTATGGGTGTVSSVTGTAPIASSGGTNPDISISQATGSTNGYLSSTDWTTFNNKGSGSVTSVAMSVPTGLSISGSPVTGSGTLAVSYATGYSIPTTASQTNWDSAYSQRLQWDGGSTNLVASTGRTSLGATTVGGNMFTLTNPNAITFPRFNADNTVSALSASAFLTAIGGGTGSVTSVGLGLPSSVFTISGSPVTGSGTLTGSFNTQAVNTVWAGPTSGAAATPTFRSLVVADIPSLSYVSSVSGTSPVSVSSGLTPTVSLSANYGDTQSPYGSKTANYFLASPNGTAGGPSFRSIVAADIPTLNQNTTGTASNVTGTVAIANGGTGQTTKATAFNALSPITTTGDIIYGSATNTSSRLGIGSAGQVLTVSGGIPAWSTNSATMTVGTSTITSGTNGYLLSQSAGKLAQVGYSANGNLLYDNGSGFASGNTTNITYTSAGTSAVAKSVYSKLTQYVTVEEFGAAGDGTTDDTAAFNAALTYAASVGKYVVANASTAGYKIAGQISFPAKVNLVGDPNANVSYEQYNTTIAPKGAWLLFTGTSSSPLRMNVGTSISGFVFYWPSQTDTNPPIAYPYCIDVTYLTDVTISNIYLVNAYKFLTAYAGHGRIHIKEVTGWVLNKGISLDGGVDVNRIEDVHFIPVWPPSTFLTSPSYAYQVANCVYLELGYQDAIQVSNFFSYGGYDAIVIKPAFSSGITGTTYGQFTNISIDWATNSGITITDYNINGLQFSNVMINSPTYGVYCTANEPNGQLQFSNVSMWNVPNGIYHAGNTEIVANDVYIASGHNGSGTAGNCINVVPTVSGYTSKLKLQNYKTINYTGVGGFTDGVMNPSAGATAQVYIASGSYNSGAILPNITKSGAGTKFLMQSGNAPAGFTVTTPTAPATTVAVTNPNPVPCQVSITGGTTTAVQINGTAVGNPATFSVGVNDTVAVTYTGTLTWIWYGF